MIAALPTPYPALNEKRIEYVLADENYKLSLWKDLAPISKGKNGVVNFQKIKDFTKQFFDELTRKKHLLEKIKTLSLLTNFVQASAEVLKYNPDIASVEFTTAKSLFVYTSKGTSKVYLELFFDEETGKFAEAVLNIYQSRTQELAINGTLNFVIQKLDGYFSPASINLYMPTETPYAISGSTTASYAF